MTASVDLIDVLERLSSYVDHINESGDFNFRALELLIDLVIVMKANGQRTKEELIDKIDELWEEIEPVHRSGRA